MLRLVNNAPALFANGKPVAIFAATAAGVEQGGTHRGGSVEGIDRERVDG
jgi:hypothetical protein